MKTIVLKNSKLNGKVKPPASKSILHRYIIAASMAMGKSNIKNINLSEDIEATINAMRTLGADIKVEKGELLVDGSSFSCSFSKDESHIIDCNESGSTLRFMIPISLIKENKVLFLGKENLFKRPLDPYFKIFEEQEIIYNFDLTKNEKLKIVGNLKNGLFKIVGNISSQFITGLLFALPHLKENSTVEITGELESKSYIDLTFECLEKFGINFINNDYKTINLKGLQKYKAREIEVESDFSQAAFFLVANALGSNLDIENINRDSLQGDKEIINLIEKVNKHNNESKALLIDGSNCPDIIPIFSLYAAYSNKKIRIKNISRLRIKESDRLSATVQELSKLGFDLQEQEDDIIINYREKTKLKNKKIFVSAHNDHRIAMMLAIAATVYQGEIILDNADCVKKSYPDFWEVYSSLGGIFNECVGK